MISSMSVPIQANNGKITSFQGGTPLWCSRSRVTPATGEQNFVTINWSPWGSPQWRFHDPSLHRFDTIPQLDRRTDRQTPRPWL